MPDLSIIIASHNTCELLDECLDSIYQAAAPPAGVEVIVVDNDSGDGSQAMVRGKYPAARLIANDDNQGFSTANNQGAAAACGEYLLFLNSDTRINPDALVRPLAYMRETPTAGALTVRLVYPNGERDPDNHRGFPTPWASICRAGPTFQRPAVLRRLLPELPRF
jgi:GT2 family glycosyltransferase